jgi:23S rRNA pseudouridine1911/1915/1917 synthase
VRLVVEDPALLLDFLQRMFPDSSRTSLRGMLQVGRVRVNGEIEKQARRALVPKDVVDVGPRASPLLPEDLSILYEDDDVIVVVKDVGLLTVATPMERGRTVQAYLNDYLKAKRIQERIHVVHRLDRDTSGVLVFAKRLDARETLKEQFARHDIERVYIAIIEGVMPQPAGTIRSHLREDADFTVRSVSDPARGKLAVTHYRTLERGNRYSRLEVR